MLDALSLSECLVGSSAKEVVLAQLFSHLVVGGVAGLVIGGEVAHEHDLVSGLELLESGRRLKQADSRHAHLGHE